MKKKAAFFDRDGTLIEDANYLDSIDKVKIIPNVLKLCKYLQSEGYKLFIITNQSGVARGYFNEKFVIESNSYIQDLFAQQGVYFKKTYYCPHLPIDNDQLEMPEFNRYRVKCLCRKPLPGLIFQAAKDFNIDLTQSFMFGDKKVDIQAGIAAGCKSFYIQDFFEKDFNIFQKLIKI